MIFFRHLFYCSFNILYHSALRPDGWVQRWKAQPTAVNWWAQGLSQADECSRTGSAGHTASNIPLHWLRLLWDGWPSPGVGWKPSPANDHRRKRASVFFRIKIGFQPIIMLVGVDLIQFDGRITCIVIRTWLGMFAWKQNYAVDDLMLNRLFVKILANTCVEYR